MSNKEFVCCICKRKVTEFGCNPLPIMHKKGEKCCNYCDNSIVTPARVLMISALEKINKIK